jgi:hypothetical protein
MWVRHTSLFDMVSNIGFYRNYINKRAFKRWLKVGGCSGRVQQLAAAAAGGCGSWRVQQLVGPHLTGAHWRAGSVLGAEQTPHPLRSRPTASSGWQACGMCRL